MTGNKVPDTEGAYPLQDLPEEFPKDLIDYDYYINKNIELLDAVIARDKTPESIYVYEYVNETRFGFDENTLRDENGQIILPMFEKAVKELNEKNIRNLILILISRFS